IVRFGSLLKPEKSLGVILADALSVEEQDSQVVVGAGKSLVGGGMEPVQRLSILYGCAPAIHIHHRQVDLGWRVSALSGLLKPLQRFFLAVVWSDYQNGSHPQLVLFEGVPLQGHLSDGCR